MSSYDSLTKTDTLEAIVDCRKSRFFLPVCFGNTLNASFFVARLQPCSKELKGLPVSFSLATLTLSFASETNLIRNMQKRVPESKRLCKHKPSKPQNQTSFKNQTKSFNPFK